MSSEEIIEKNKALVDDFPFLLPRNRWTGKVPDDYDYSYTELDAMPEGWRTAFGLQALARDRLSMKIFEKEKNDVFCCS